MKCVGSMNIIANRNVLAMKNPSGWRFNSSTAPRTQMIGANDAAKVSIISNEIRNGSPCTMSGNPTRCALYSSYTCAMNMITVSRYGTMTFCGSIMAFRRENHQSVKPPANRTTYASASGPTNRYSNSNHAATNNGI